MKFLKYNLLPIILAVAALFVLVFLFLGLTNVINIFPVQEKISLNIQPIDVLIGLTIYLKTSIDFALLIGILMNRYPGLKNRFAIEIGTALGNAFGTMVVLVLWVIFKEITLLLAIMVIFASLVLFKMAQVSLEHIGEDNPDTTIDNVDVKVNPNILKVKTFLNKILDPINKFLDPLISRVIPDLKFNSKSDRTFKALFLASFTIPFILGSDDFAGYVPLFNVVHVFGFGIGVSLGHTLLNIFLFLSPKITVKVIKNPIISVIGSVAFIILALWGLYEALNILFIHH